MYFIHNIEKYFTNMAIIFFNIVFVVVSFIWNLVQHPDTLKSIFHESLSRVLSSILSSGFCVCGISVHFLCVHTDFLWVIWFPPTNTHQRIGYVTLPLGAKWVYIPFQVYSGLSVPRNRLWIYLNPDQNKWLLKLYKWMNEIVCIQYDSKVLESWINMNMHFC